MFKSHIMLKNIVCLKNMVLNWKISEYTYKYMDIKLKTDMNDMI